MKRGLLAIVIIILAVLLIGVWFLTRTAVFSPTQQEAVEGYLNVKADKFIAVSQANNRSLAFFTNSDNKLLAASLVKGMFGYKVKAVGSKPINLEQVKTDQLIPFKTAFRSSDKNIVYGLALSEKVDIVLVKDIPAANLPLEAISTKLKTRKFKLWYVETINNVDINKDIKPV